MQKVLSEEHKQNIRKGMTNYWDSNRGEVLQKNGYITICIGNRRYYKHRLVVEEHLGRKLLPSEEVHHINGDKTDNRIENLILTTHADHQREHAIKNGLGKDRVGKEPSIKASVEQRNMIFNLREQGLSLSQIGKKVGLSKTTVSNYLKGKSKL